MMPVPIRDETDLTRPPQETWRRRWIGLVLVLGVLAVYGSLVLADFIGYDDPSYVVSNPVVKRGLTAAGVKWAFTTTDTGYWHPVTWLTLMLDHEVYGLHAGGYHVTNILLHAANTVLLFGLLCRMTGATWRSGVVAALFAWHPLHVESVAWVSERKDVLSTFFWLLSALAYVRYVQIKNEKLEIKNAEKAVQIRRQEGWHYGAALGFFALGLMSKPMVVTLPFVLLLLDYWPLRRSEEGKVKRDTGIGDCRLQNGDLENRPGKEKSVEGAGTAEVRGAVECAPISAMGMWKWSSEGWGRLVLEKVPFLVLAAASSVVTYVAQKSGGAMALQLSTTFHERVANAAVSYVRYIGKLVWPWPLAVFYPYVPRWAGWEVAGSAAVLAGITAAVILMRGRRYLLVGWLWYIGMLVPVIGLVQAGSQSIADRYMYLPAVGLCIMAVWGLAEAVERRPRAWRGALAGTGGVVLAACLAVAFRQALFWRDSLTLFSHAAAVTPDNFVVRDNLGSALLSLGKIKEATEQFEGSERLEPGGHLALCGLGLICVKEGKMKEAAGYFEEGLKRWHGYSVSGYTLARQLAAHGDYVGACEQYSLCAPLKPDEADLYYNFANALLEQGKPAEAAAEYRKSIALEPKSADAHNNLAAALIRLGEANEAIRELQEALRLKPDFAKAEDQMAVALQKLGRDGEAEGYYLRAIQHEPTLAHARLKLGLLLGQSGQTEAAREQFEKVIELEPTNDTAYYDIGESYAAEGNYGKAAGAFDQAVKLKPDDPETRMRLADTLARGGDYGEAISQYREAIRLRPNEPAPLCALAALLANCPVRKWRNGTEAVELAERATGLSGGKNLGVMAILDQAYAEAGRMEDAIRTAEAEIDLARGSGQEANGEAAARRLELYRTGRRDGAAE
jgi:tetratricopeptide (TPR) repeat protein